MYSLEYPVSILSCVGIFGRISGTMLFQPVSYSVPIRNNRFPMPAFCAVHNTKVTGMRHCKQICAVILVYCHLHGFRVFVQKIIPGFSCKNISFPTDCCSLLVGILTKADNNLRGKDLQQIQEIFFYACCNPLFLEATGTFPLFL